MNRRIHWFLVVSFSSLMLFGLDTCYGVGDKDPSNFLFNFVYSSQVNGERKGDLLKENLIDRYRISKEDLKKVEKGFFTLREIISAKTDLIQFIQECDSATVENSRKIALLQLSANFGNETAINHLLEAYRKGWYGLRMDDLKGLELAKKYADQGSESAIGYLLDSYAHEENDAEALKLAKKYADQGSEESIGYLLDQHELNDLAGLELAKKYADQGSERAVIHFLDANCRYRLTNDEERLAFIKKYADQGSKWAMTYLLDIYRRGWCGFQKDDPKGLKLAEMYVNQGNNRALGYLLLAYHQGWYGLPIDDPKSIHECIIVLDTGGFPYPHHKKFPLLLLLSEEREQYQKKTDTYAEIIKLGHQVKYYKGSKHISFMDHGYIDPPQSFKSKRTLL